MALKSKSSSSYIYNVLLQYSDLQLIVTDLVSDKGNQTHLTLTEVGLGFRRQRSIKLKHGSNGKTVLQHSGTLGGGLDNHGSKMTKTLAQMSEQ